MNITFRPHYTADYSIVLSKTVTIALNALHAAGKIVVSVEEVTEAINANCPARIQFTEQQVAGVMRRFAKEMETYTYAKMHKLVNLGMDFYQYGK